MISTYLYGVGELLPNVMLVEELSGERILYNAREPSSNESFILILVSHNSISIIRVINPTLFWCYITFLFSIVDHNHVRISS